MIGDPHAGIGQPSPVHPEDVARRTVRDDTPAGLEHHDPVDEGDRLVHPMLDEDERRAQAVQDAGKDLAHLGGAIRIEVSGRLVEHEEARPEGKRAGERQALLLATRERMGRPVARVRKLDRRQRSVHARPDAVGRDASVLEPEGDVVTGAAHDDL
jgi:hypothetical protein